MDTKPYISIIVCTYNGAARLPDLLESLKNMTPLPVLWEVVVVDNGSSDNTREVISNFMAKSSCQVKYACERKPGLANARNKGMKTAQGKYVAFTDDDCIVDPNWLREIVKEFEFDPDLALIGGRVELFNQEDKPVTIKTSRERVVFSSPGQLFNLLPGCNMAFASDLVNRIGLFDPLFGAGAPFKSAEDSDFFYRAHRNGCKMIYTPTVLIYHNHGRRTDEEVWSLNRGYVIGRGAMYCKYIMRGDYTIFKLAMNSEIL